MYSNLNIHTNTCVWMPAFRYAWSASQDIEFLVRDCTVAILIDSSNDVFPRRRTPCRDRRAVEERWRYTPGGQIHCVPVYGAQMSTCRYSPAAWPWFRIAGCSAAEQLRRGASSGNLSVAIGLSAGAARLSRPASLRAFEQLSGAA